MAGSRPLRTTVFVPGDAAALALGADAVAVAIATEAARRGIDLRLVRNGSRGMVWLEPLVEVATAQGRIAYGPVAAADVPGLFAADFMAGGAHALCLGPTDEIPWLARQQRLACRRIGVVDPRSLADYVARGGGEGLRQARAMAPAAIVAAVSESGLRGRGGAAFPAGIKWQTVLATAAAQKYIVCNADEGDSGTFSDRMLMEGDPFQLFEGMAIAGLAVGATQGYIYVRSEYPHAIAALEAALEEAGDFLGSFKVEVRKGAGSYVCGEETALLESLEGRRGIVRAKPPLPAICGLFGQPTVINNVITFASVPDILAQGAAAYRDLGVGRSRGTLPFQLAGNIKHGGLVEVPFGLTLRQLLYDFGGGSRSGRPLRAVQVGGPLGAYLPTSQFDTVLDYEAFATIGGGLGHGGIVAFDDTVDMAQQARYAMKFCAVESCGKCTPCRIGSTRGVEVIDRIRAGQEEQIELLQDLCETMSQGSLCAMGSMTPIPVMSALRHFPGDFGDKHK
ncbi:MAG: formate dehydrogenase [Rhodocyclales bacterium]|nr:formate dehydrogenase [Rhodocyclales bacterium]